MAEKRVQIYHNPRCSKSRATLALLRERGIEPEIILYLETPPSVDTLNALLTLLKANDPAFTVKDMMRTGEAAYKDKGLNQHDLPTVELLQAIHDHPILLQRPIVTVNHQKAAIGRPPEAVLSLL